MEQRREAETGRKLGYSLPFRSVRLYDGGWTPHDKIADSDLQEAELNNGPVISFVPSTNAQYQLISKQKYPIPILGKSNQIGKTVKKVHNL